MGWNQRGRQNCHNIMKRLLVLFVGFMFMTSAHAVPGVVDYHFDGDTFSAQVKLAPDAEITVRVRLINVDTPEMNGACQAEKIMAQSARDLLKTIIPRGTIVELENIKDDKYLGRIDANVVLSDGRDVGEILIDSGLGRRYSGGKRKSWCE